MKPRIAVLLSLFVALAPAAPALAQDSPKLTELERKVDILTQEIEKLKLGDTAEPTAEKSVSGFSPAASKIYFTKPSKVSICAALRCGLVPRAPCVSAVPRRPNR